MPREYCEMPNDVLVTLATNGDHGASGERLTREIMAVDQITWDKAQAQLQLINAAKGSTFVGTLPYKAGIVIASACGLATIPLCFDLSTALWFNDAFVTTEVPPDEDLETWLEVGSWTWGWMEPPIGQLSFLLLTIQFAMSELDHLNSKSYSDLLKGT